MALTANVGDGAASSESLQPGLPEMGNGPSQILCGFHLFPCLPPELRHRIWDLSVETLEIDLPIYRPLRGGLYRQPALLQACSESREYLTRRGGYVKSFWYQAHDYENAYLWVNFDVDTVCPPMYAEIPSCPETQLIQNLAIYNPSQGFPLFRYRGKKLRALPALRNVTCSPEEALDSQWWMEWVHYFDSLYGAETEPVTFRLRVFRPRRIINERAGSKMVGPVELNPDNYTTWSDAGREALSRRNIR